MADVNPMQDPKNMEFFRHCEQTLVPLIAESAVGVSVVPVDRTETDVRFAIQIGLLIMMDKPIILVVEPGTSVPSKLVKVADHIVETDLCEAAGKRQLLEAIESVVAKLRSN